MMSLNQSKNAIGGYATALFLSLSAVALNGCAGAVIGAGATASVAVVQERSVGDAVDDATIQLKINEGLLQADEKLFGAVGTVVLEGRVLLTGNVPTPDDRVRAVRLTWKVEGVKEVLNELQVASRGSVVQYFKDAKVTTQLRFLMLKDRDISDVNYSVETVTGIVYLMGLAKDQAELNKVINHARNIAGVAKVISHVYLVNDKRRRT